MNKPPITTIELDAPIELKTVAPEPLRRPVPPAAPYPVGELGPALTPACRAIQRVVQAPDAICAASLLAAASLSAQSLADVHVDGRIIPLSLWMLTIADSGERKSAVDGEAMRGIEAAERTLFEEYTAAKARGEARTGKAGNRSDSPHAHQFESNPEAPLNPMLTAADFTADGITKLLEIGRPGIGIFSNEAGVVFGGHGMAKETVMRTIATFCKLWDNGTLDRVRVMDGASKQWGKRLALHLMIQPIIAERVLSNELLAGQGFLARCLLAWPEGTAGSRTYVAESLCDDPAMLSFAARTRELLLTPLPLADGTRSELTPRPLTLTEEAKRDWVAFYNWVETHESPDCDFATCKPWASKAAEQCLRVAGVLTVFENPTATTIAPDAIRRAIVIVTWHLRDALRLIGTVDAAPEIRDAEALLDWCHQTGRTLLHSRDALRLGPNRIRDRKRLMQAMPILESASWAVRIEGGMVIDGASRKNVWRIVPKPLEP